jgi:uncharacterized membrane protein
LLAVVLIIIIFSFSSNVLRIVLGIPFLLFFPGYLLVSALFPRKQGLDGIQRAGLSLGMSIAVVPLIGLILNYTPWGITLESALSSITTFIVIMSVIVWVRRKQLPAEERFGIEFNIKVPGWTGNAWDRVLTTLLVISVLGVIAAASYAIATPKEGDSFTEFYVLGAGGEAVYNPKHVILECDVEVIVGIINHENETVSYRLVVTLDGVEQTEIESIVLVDDERWEQLVSITPKQVGEDQKIEFLLFKDGSAEPCAEPLHLWISVSS